MGDALPHFVIEQDIENIWLKRETNELEEALIRRPLYMTPLAIIAQDEAPLTIPNTSNKINKFEKLLNGIKTSITKNINKWLSIIYEARDIHSYLRKFSQIISSLLIIKRRVLIMTSILFKMI